MSAFSERVKAFKTFVIVETVRKHGWNRKKAAAELGVSLWSIGYYIGNRKKPERARNQGKGE